MLNKAESSDILRQDTIRKLRERYPGVHPVVFIRSLEKARTLGHLFDILDTFSGEFPVKWVDLGR